MTTHNPNEAITNLSMPERSIPVLLECNSKQRDGLTALSDVSPESKSVRRVSQEMLRVFLDTQCEREFERCFGPVPARDRRHLLYLLGLADALNRRDARSLRRVVREYVASDEEEGRCLQEVRKSPLHELHENLNLGIRGARFIVWWAERERKLAPGLLCKDVATALFVLVLSTIGQPGGLGICQRPQCRKPFIRLRSAPKQRYCSYKCQAAAGMIRYRKRSKRMSAKGR
jgi:hypothetical protein